MGLRRRCHRAEELGPHPSDLAIVDAAHAVEHTRALPPGQPPGQHLDLLSVGQLPQRLGAIFVGEEHRVVSVRAGLLMMHHGMAAY
jgi:hypothetical protein